MVEWLIEPLAYGFFQRGLAGGILAAVACGVLSGFIVWRGMAFIGDALSHSILPGIVLSYALGVNLLLGAIAASLVAVAGIGLISQRNGFKGGLCHRGDFYGPVCFGDPAAEPDFHLSGSDSHPVREYSGDFQYGPDYHRRYCPAGGCFGVPVL